MVTQSNSQRVVYYKRYSKPRHFYPAPGYNCPKIPLGSINCKGPDYESVRVIRAHGCFLRGRRILISWGLNLPKSKWPNLKQVLAIDVDRPKSEFAEIVLAVG